jgi:hypothetical protein
LERYKYYKEIERKILLQMAIYIYIPLEVLYAGLLDDITTKTSASKMRFFYIFYLRFSKNKPLFRLASDLRTIF